MFPLDSEYFISKPVEKKIFPLMNLEDKTPLKFVFEFETRMHYMGMR